MPSRPEPLNASGRRPDSLWHVHVRVAPRAWRRPVRLFAEVIVRGFSADEAVVAGALQVWPWVCVVMFLDAIMAIGNGLLRGLGLARRSALSVILSLWCVGFPLVVTTTHTIEQV